MQALAIIVLCVLAACGYGIVHDQITARICIEYFTVAHPPIFDHPVNSPTVLGFVWGIIATWWVGLGLGIPLAFAARFGNRPKRSVHDVTKPILLLLCVMGVLALAAGVVGFLLASAGWINLTGSLADKVPADHHTALITDAFAHNMSYLSGAVGGIIVIVKTWRSRQKQASQP